MFKQLNWPTKSCLNITNILFFLYVYKQKWYDHLMKIIDLDIVKKIQYKNLRMFFVSKPNFQKV